MKTEILSGLWLGGVEDAQTCREMDKVGQAWATICVHENPDNVVYATHWIPVMVGGRHDEEFYASHRMLNAATDIIQHYRERFPSKPVLLHCGHGCERAPLTMAWYLRRFHGEEFKSVNAAYDHICDLRPLVQRRTHWLDER